MPPSPKRICSFPGCRTLSLKGRCEKHRIEAWADRGSSGSRGYGHAWRKLRRQILERDNYLCHCPECLAFKRLRPASEVDHIIPKARGGSDAHSNLRAVNEDCHKRLTQGMARSFGLVENESR